VPARTITNTGDKFADYNAPLDGYDIHRVETEILAHLDDTVMMTGCGWV